MMRLLPSTVSVTKTNRVRVILQRPECLLLAFLRHGNPNALANAVASARCAQPSAKVSSHLTARLSSVRVS